MSLTDIPIVLCISGHDPGGGAGIQADIEAVAANGCHPCTVVTALTAQNTCRLQRLSTQPTTELRLQLQSLLEDITPTAIKIGLLGSVETAYLIAEFLGDWDSIPVVLDPILATGSGQSVADVKLLTAIKTRLLPLVTLVTPNSREARLLASVGDDPLNCSQQLIDRGCGYALITGTHEQGSMVVNRLYSSTGLIDESHWQRLPGEYHGSGCTLASAISARLALAASASPAVAETPQETIQSAVRQGQAYTWQALRQAFTGGHCQRLPNRLYMHRNQQRP